MEKKLLFKKTLWHIMRLTFVQMILMAVFCTMAYAHDTAAQEILNKGISIKAEAQSLKTILAQIEKQTNARFVYSDTRIPIDKQVFIEANSQKLATVLNDLLPPLSIQYQVSGNYIVLSKLKNEIIEEALPPTFIVTGVVTNEKGEPLVGAGVALDGTTKGTVTDENGKFSLELADTDKKGNLTVSFIGYDKQTVAIDGRTAINIVLSEGKSLSEVVVVGYGSSKKEGLTGSVQTLRSDVLEGVPLASVEQMLQGNVAGLQANMGNGQPGSKVQVRIRGLGSITASSEPLYVIDGIPISSDNIASSDGQVGLYRAVESANPLSSLNPNDIESLSVLKDASATAIYGARAANGVVLITTKQGKAGKTKIKLSAQQGVNDWALGTDRKGLRGLTSAEYIDLWMDGEINKGTTVANAIKRFNTLYPDPISGLPAADLTASADGKSYTVGQIRVDNRWIDAVARKGNTQDYNLSLSGGNNLVTYYASGGYFKQEAGIIYSDLERFSGRLNMEVNATPKLKFANNITLSKTSQQGMNDGARFSNPLYSAYQLPPLIPAYGTDGLSYIGHAPLLGGFNPVGSLSGDDETKWGINRILDNVSATYKIINNLTFKSAWSFDLLNYSEFYYRNARFGNDGAPYGGYAHELTRRDLNWIGTQTLDYNYDIKKAHNFNFLLGYEAQKFSRRTVQAFGQQFPPNSSLRTLENAATSLPSLSNLSEYAFESYFSRLAYNYNYKYYLQGSIRRDGSSRFGPDNRYGTFWSLGGSWRLDQEAFIKPLKFINELKLRTSYGLTGNAGISNFAWFPSISFASISYNGQPGGAPLQIGNKELTWEQNKSFNIGLDFAMLKNNFSGTIEYFNRESSNLLLDVPVSRTTGFLTEIQNLGAMKNSGYELTMNGNIINTKDVKFSVGGNITLIKNVITKLKAPFSNGGTNPRFYRTEGRPFDDYFVFGYAGVDPATGAALFYTDETETTKTTKTTLTKQYFVGKSATPDFFGGFNTKISYKGFFANSDFTYSWGNWLYDVSARVIQSDGAFADRSTSALTLDRWRKPGDITTVPIFISGNKSQSNLTPSSRWLRDGTYIRLRNLNVGYDFPKEWLEKPKINAARVYIRGINLLTWTRDPELYMDPEANLDGSSASQIPNLKTVSIGVDITF